MKIYVNDLAGENTPTTTTTSTHTISPQVVGGSKIETNKTRWRETLNQWDPLQEFFKELSFGE